MHLHILGICGTFMGGMAALARGRPQGDRLRRQRLPAHEHPARSLGIELIEGFGAEQLALKPDVFVIGNVVTRGERFR
jgi:UDP-N-acetylmuramate: L-alanyl-gamma-D-glutamyl-meso-diaminopimelate ligase